MRLIDADVLTDGRVENDPVVIAAKCADTIELDRSRWEGCPNCNKWRVCGYRSYKPAYCRDCGKPLNEEAWAELERRIKNEP